MSNDNDIKDFAQENPQESTNFHDDFVVLKKKYDELNDNYEKLSKKNQELEETSQKTLRTAAYVQTLYNELKEKMPHEIQRERKKVKSDIFHSIIKFIDMLELTLHSIGHHKSDKSVEAIINGVNMVYKYIINDLENQFKLKKIICNVGDAFDSQIHEAQKTVDTHEDHLHNTIARVVSGGYLLEDQVFTNPVVDVYIKNN